jgi:hypothetical protein
MFASSLKKGLSKVVHEHKSTNYRLYMEIKVKRCNMIQPQQM